ncbi:hypothetical protein CCZ01_05540 [Helicobacter monodelphidis]|uniref:hypothetical protein n=1 Tax=Helicobacter sp. 15-1451 TaxID=2004995 RepID=UPI000DCEB530|nr:hypothetical protein [Helicobacter sp. 15-1451]RAX57605.1 hypothetical protein CCZ01_05540 [Helicobacter sp. 15-1451]
MKRNFLYAIILGLLMVCLLILPVKMGEEGANRHIPILGYVEDISHSYYNETLLKLSATWASVKFASKMVAVFQRGEISFTPFGMGVTIAPGELLAAVSDNLERVSSLLFSLILVVLGERLAVSVMTFLTFKVFLPFSLLLIILSLLFNTFRIVTQKWGFLILKTTLLLYCILPASAFLSAFVQSHYLDETYQKEMDFVHSKQEQLESLEIVSYSQKISEQDEVLSQQKTSTDSSWVEQTLREGKKIAESTLEGMKKTIKQVSDMHFEEMRKQLLEEFNNALSFLDAMVDRFMSIITIFLLTNIAIPLVLFVVMMRMVNYFWQKI